MFLLCVDHFLFEILCTAYHWPTNLFCRRSSLIDNIWQFVLAFKTYWCWGQSFCFYVAFLLPYSNCRFMSRHCNELYLNFYCNFYQLTWFQSFWIMRRDMFQYIFHNVLRISLMTYQIWCPHNEHFLLLNRKTCEALGNFFC